MAQESRGRATEWTPAKEYAAKHQAEHKRPLSKLLVVTLVLSALFVLVSFMFFSPAVLLERFSYDPVIPVWFIILPMVIFVFGLRSLLADTKEVSPRPHDLRNSLLFSAITSMIVLTVAAIGFLIILFTSGNMRIG